MEHDVKEDGTSPTSIDSLPPATRQYLEADQKARMYLEGRKSALHDMKKLEPHVLNEIKCSGSGLSRFDFLGDPSVVETGSLQLVTRTKYDAITKKYIYNGFAAYLKTMLSDCLTEEQIASTSKGAAEFLWKQRNATEMKVLVRVYESDQQKRSEKRRAEYATKKEHQRNTKKQKVADEENGKDKSVDMCE